MGGVTLESLRMNEALGLVSMPLIETRSAYSCQHVLGRTLTEAVLVFASSHADDERRWR